MAASSRHYTPTTSSCQVDGLFDFSQRFGLNKKFWEGGKCARPGMVNMLWPSAEWHAIVELFQLGGHKRIHYEPEVTNDHKQTLGKEEEERIRKVAGLS